MMHTEYHTTTPSALEPRFQQPEGWRWHSFTTPRGKKLRFGVVAPQSRLPDAVVICLPGLSEFAEKYYELAQNMLDQNLSFWVLDWQGQGKSSRSLGNRQKRHSSGFQDDIDDLHYFLNEYVKHAAVHPDIGRIPLVMLAHSMGGNIGMRYMMQYPDSFACAAFSAPMFGIFATRFLPPPLALGLSAFLKMCFNKSYVFGGKDWHEAERDIKPPHNLFSGDPVRGAVHNFWYKTDPALQVGNVTFGWLYAALKSCHKLQKNITRHPVTIPCLFGIAGRDLLVDNKAIYKAASSLPDATLVEFKESRHEILMEGDGIRGVFLSAFFDFLARNEIREKRVPF